MGKDAEALYAAEAKERQGTRTDLMQNIEANLPQSQPEPKTRERAAKQAGKFKGRRKNVPLPKLALRRRAFDDFKLVIKR